MSQRKTLGSLLVRLGMTDREADKAIKDFERKLRNLQRNVENIGRKMSVGLTIPIAGFAAASVKAASDAEETFSKFGVVFSKVAKDAERSFQLLRNQYGLSSKSAKQLLSDTGDLLTGFGFSQEAALDLSTQVNTLAVDLASFTNFSGGAEGASQALTKALLGERESVKALGIAILDSDVKKQMALDASKGLTFETERQAKAYATLQIALAQSKNAQGDYARTSGSFANQTRLLKERVNDLAVEFGTIMMPAAQKLVKHLQDLTEWFKQLSPATKQYIVEIGGMVAMAGPILILTSNILKLANSLKILGVNLNALGSNGVKAGILALASIGIGAGRDAMIGDREAYEKDLAERARRAYSSGDQKEIMKVRMAANSTAALDLLGGFNVGDARRVQAIGRGEGMSGLTNRGGGLAGYLDKVGDTEVEKTFDSTTQAVNDYSKALQHALHWQTQLLSPNRGNPAAGMSSIQPNLNPAMAGQVGNGGLTPLTGVGGNAQGIADMMNIQPNLDPIIEMENRVLSVKDSFITMGDVIGAVMGDVANSLRDGGKSFGEYALSAVAAIAKVIQAKMMELAINIVSGEAAKSGLPGAIIGLVASTAVLAGISKLMSSQKPPKLAKGALAFGPTMAVVGDNPNAHVDPEVISPLSKLKGMMQGGMGGRMQVDVVGMISGDHIRLATARSQDRAIRNGSASIIRSDIINY